MAANLFGFIALTFWFTVPTVVMNRFSLRPQRARDSARHVA
ncbi:MAG: hypothetical protein ABI612_10425 [Betaproteobacteria bacterium]